MSRPTPSRKHAKRMLKAILAQRDREGPAGPHPLDTVDLDSDVDRWVIGGVYAFMVLETMAR